MAIHSLTATALLPSAELQYKAVSLCYVIISASYLMVTIAGYWVRAQHEQHGQHVQHAQHASIPAWAAPGPSASPSPSTGGDTAHLCAPCRPSAMPSRPTFLPHLLDPPGRFAWSSSSPSCRSSAATRWGRRARSGLQPGRASKWEDSGPRLRPHPHRGLELGSPKRGDVTDCLPGCCALLCPACCGASPRLQIYCRPTYEAVENWAMDTKQVGGGFVVGHVTQLPSARGVGSTLWGMIYCPRTPSWQRMRLKVVPPLSDHRPPPAHPLCRPPWRPATCLAAWW